MTLARAEFLVCTFGSHIGRLAYELMHSVRHDAFSRVVSLDIEYFFLGLNKIIKVALADHHDARLPDNKTIKVLQKGDIVLRKFAIGQIVDQRGSQGVFNFRTNKSLTAPTYKLIEFHRLYENFTI